MILSPIHVATICLLTYASSCIYILEQTPIAQPGSRPKTSLARPKSGTVRPLSSRVFIRRTVKNGWVAKGVDGSRVDLDDEDDEWDANSVDSFFDDDFEEHETEDALKDLLSCNTLGVDSKVRKRESSPCQINCSFSSRFFR